MLAALLVPFSGILRGCISIARGKSYGESDLHHAARAGASCALVRTENWKPQRGDVLFGYKHWRLTVPRDHPNTLIRAVLTVDMQNLPKHRVNRLMDNIHGQIINLPSDDYAFHTLPVDANVVPEHNGDIELCKNHDILKGLAAVLQL